jgi:hypothetical protein
MSRRKWSTEVNKLLRTDGTQSWRLQNTRITLRNLRIQILELSTVLLWQPTQVYTSLCQNYRGSNTNSHIHTKWHSTVSVHASFSNAPGEQNIQLRYKPNGWTLSNTNFMSVPIWQKKTRLHYKHRLAVYQNNHCLFRASYQTSKYCAGKCTTFWNGAKYSTHCDLTAKKVNYTAHCFWKRLLRKIMSEPISTTVW